MGKKSGITKAGRNMNPADRERKQQRAKELKRNKKQRVQVRHAIVKSRNPDEIIEALSRLDDQGFFFFTFKNFNKHPLRIWARPTTFTECDSRKAEQAEGVLLPNHWPLPPGEGWKEGEEFGADDVRIWGGTGTQGRKLS